MKPRNDSRLNRELVSVFLALLVGLGCFGAGHWMVAEMVKTRATASAQKLEEKQTCDTSPRLAGLGARECDPPRQLHPMRFK